MALKHGKTPVNLWNKQTLDKYNVDFLEFMKDAPVSIQISPNWKTALSIEGCDSGSQRR